jgi:hypothetical protein
MAYPYSHTTRANGTILTAAIYNADHLNHATQQIPEDTDDYSVSVTEMRTVTDPGEVGSESLATNLAGELERLRFAIKEIKGTAQWYETPAADPAVVVGVNFVIDGIGAEITPGIQGYIEMPFAGTITQATLLADQTGSIVVDIFKSTYADFDPTTTPDADDKITASAPPTITTAKKAQDSTLTGWTTAVAAGDVLAVNVNSVTTIERCTLSLLITKS